MGMRQSAVANPFQNPSQLVEIEPDAVFGADIDDDSTSSPVVAAIHQLLAFGTGTVERFGGVTQIRNRRVAGSPLRRPGQTTLPSTFFERLESGPREPHARAARALEDREALCAQSPAEKVLLRAANRTAGVDLLAGGALRRYRNRAGMAVARLAADAGCASRADRIEILFVKGEVRVAELAIGGGGQPRSATGGAPHDCRFVRCRRRDFDELATDAVKLAAVPAGGVELPFTGRAGHEMAQLGDVGHARFESTIGCSRDCEELAE